MMKFTMNAKELKTMMEKGMAAIDKKASLQSLTRLYFEVDGNGIVKVLGTNIEHYAEVRNTYNKKDNKFSDEYIALIGYCASYGGRFFDGGYGRDKTGKRNIYKERVLNLKEQAVNLKDISFDCKNYTSINPNDYFECLFYLDPPYKGTKIYSKQNIDYDHFYD